MIPNDAKKIIQSSIAVVKAHRAMLRARDEEATAKVREKYRRDLSEALKALDAAVSVFKPAPQAEKKAAGPGMDWNAFLGTAVRGLELVRDIRGKSPKDVRDWVEAEVVDFGKGRR